MNNILCTLWTTFKMTFFFLLDPSFILLQSEGCNIFPSRSNFLSPLVRSSSFDYCSSCIYELVLVYYAFYVTGSYIWTFFEVSKNLFYKKSLLFFFLPHLLLIFFFYSSNSPCILSLCVSGIKIENNFV